MKSYLIASIYLMIKLNVDVMWSNVDVLWSNVDSHISNVNKCRYIVGQNNGDLRSFLGKYELYVGCHT